MSRAGWLQRALALGALVLGPSCVLVEYSDDLVDDTTRSNFVTQPASVGGIVGFIAGVPLDIAALPVSYTVYSAQKEEEESVDPLSTLLFPSFVLWRAGVILVGTPFDALEFVFHRAWREPPAKLQPEYDAGVDARSDGDGGTGQPDR